MSWYFLGGFSAYFSVPSGRWRNHSGCSLSHGWSGEHWMARSSAMSMPVLRGGGAQRARRRRACPAPRAPRRGRPSRRRSPTASRGRRGPATSALLRALAVGEADGVDGRQVEDVEAELGQPRELRLHAAQPAEGAREQLVPGAEARPHALHLERRAPAPASSRRSARRCAPPRRTARGRARRRAWPPRARRRRRRWPARARSAAWSPLAGAVAAACRSSTTPSLSSPARSCWPPATLRSSSSRQVANRSVQACTVNSQRPIASTTKEPSQRTPLWCASTGRSSALDPLVGRPAAARGSPRAACRGRRGTRRRRPARGPPPCASRGSGRRPPSAAGTGCGSAGRAVELASRRASGREYPLPDEPKRRPVREPRPHRRGAAAPDLAARRPPGPRRPTPGSTGWRRRASRGGRCCRWARPTAGARRTSRAPPSPPRRRCWPSPAAPVTQGRGARLPRARGGLDRGLGARGRAAARWPTRCASTASGARCAPTPPSAACG